MRIQAISLAITSTAIYFFLLLAGAALLPLRLDEILQLAGFRSDNRLIHWIAQTPGAAPLNYFVQYPFISPGRVSPIAVRLASIFFALGTCWVFWGVAHKVQLRNRLVAVATFALLPAHYVLATSATPPEQALFFLVFATMWFFRLITSPAVSSAVVYALLLTACLYTAPFSYLPAVGYLLSLLRFINRKQERRAFWFALPATALPPLAFAPYLAWSAPQAYPYWLFLTPHAASFQLQGLEYLSGAENFAYLLSGIILVLAVLSAWNAIRPVPSVTPRRIALLCLFGGVVSTLGIVLLLDSLNGSAVLPAQVAYACPALLLTAIGGLESIASSKRIVAVLGLAVSALCAAGDLQYVRDHRSIDIQAEAAAIPPELTGDSCVVFVSERLSHYLFQVFEPDLERHECQNFFHSRIVLAIHPYVRADQQRDAESFFRGLNFVELKRKHVGGGDIIVMQQSG